VTVLATVVAWRSVRSEGRKKKKLTSTVDGLEAVAARRVSLARQEGDEIDQDPAPSSAQESGKEKKTKVKRTSPQFCKRPQHTARKTTATNVALLGRPGAEGSTAVGALLAAVQSLLAVAAGLLATAERAVGVAAAALATGTAGLSAVLIPQSGLELCH
jgi:hypothetical protein